MRLRGTVVAFVVLGLPRVAWAGMPSFDLTDVASLRLRAISFFAVALLLCALAVKGIWNSLRKDFPRLPYLSYGKALGLMVLWGLLFLLVLTMISGARELMTPGAWKKEGATYQLSQGAPENAPAFDPEPERRERLLALKDHLWKWAAHHGGQLPPDDKVGEIPASAWRVVDHPDAARYVYRGGLRTGMAAAVAWEPQHYGSERWVLLASGEVVKRAAKELALAR